MLRSSSGPLGQDVVRHGACVLGVFCTTLGGFAPTGARLGWAESGTQLKQVSGQMMDILLVKGSPDWILARVWSGWPGGLGPQPSDGGPDAPGGVRGPMEPHPGVQNPGRTCRILGWGIWGRPGVYGAWPGIQTNRCRHVGRNQAICRPGPNPAYEEIIFVSFF